MTLASYMSAIPKALSSNSILLLLIFRTNSDGTAVVMTRVAKFKVAGVGETGVPRGKPTI